MKRGRGLSLKIYLGRRKVARQAPQEERDEEGGPEAAQTLGLGRRGRHYLDRLDVYVYSRAPGREELHANEAETQWSRGK